MSEIERLQEYLLTFRRVLGWSAEEFGERIGVTRQTINNLESKRNRLSKTQYIAIRAVFDAEINESPEDTEILACLLDVLIDNPDKYDESAKKKLLDKTNMITPSIAAGTATRMDVSKELMNVSKAVGLVIVAGVVPMIKPMAVGGSIWLKSILGIKK